MFIVSVIPISRGIAREELSYFSSKKIEGGSLVRVPLRNREVPAIVVSTEKVRNNKTKLKSQTFKIRKITNGEVSTLLSKKFLEAAYKISDYFATTTGATLNALIPQTILNNPLDIEKKKTKKNSTFEESILQAPKKDLYKIYKKIVDKSFAKKSSILLLSPTIQDIKKIKEIFDNENTFVLHSKLSTKKVHEVWRECVQYKKPVLIIGTGSILSVPRHDIGTIIIDNESSGTYKMQGRPFIDIRTSARIFAKTIDASCVYAGTILSAEKHLQKDRNKIKALKEYTAIPSPNYKLLDMRIDKESVESTSFNVFSPELLKFLDKKNASKKIFLFTTRRGLATFTVCRDCGQTVECQKCSSPIVLHSHSQERFYVCHHCGQKERAERKCTNCNGWRLEALGIGTEKVATELAKHVPKWKIFQIDSDSTKTHAAAGKVVKAWDKSDGGILIGTGMALPFIENADISAVISLDSLLVLPDFRLNERLFALLSFLSTHTKDTPLIQTRNPEHELLTKATNMDSEKFYANELHERKQFLLPPFFKLITITARGSKSNIARGILKIEKMLEKYSPETFDAFIKKERGQYVKKILLRLPSENWVDRGLLEILRSLQPEFEVNVEPENLL